MEIVGEFVPIRDATGGPNTRAALRSADLEVDMLEVAQSLRPRAISHDGVLSTFYVPDPDQRLPGFDSASKVTAIFLRVESMDTTWAAIRSVRSDDPVYKGALFDSTGLPTRVYFEITKDVQVACVPLVQVACVQLVPRR